MQWKKSMKNGSNINPKSMKNGPNIDQTSFRIEVWRRLGGVLETSWGVLGRLGSILGCLGRFRAVLRAFWGCLEASGKRLGVVLEAYWSRLGDVLERLGSSWGVMWASWERLGGILCLIFRPKWAKFNLLSCMSFCKWFLMDFASKNQCPNYEKSFHSIGKRCLFCFQAVLT